VKKLRIKLKNYDFTPPWLLVIVAPILIAILIGLGSWQLDRAEQKQTLLTQLQARQHGKPLTGSDLKQTKDLAFKPIILAGQFDNQHQLLLDNKFHQHRPGFHVITPMKIAGSNKLILLHRGWVPRGRKREDLPKLRPYNTTQTIEGIIYQPTKKLLLLSAVSDGIKVWPRIIQRLDFPAIEKQLSHPVYPFLVILDPKQAQGFIQDWTPVIMQPSRHLGYAFQWFALAATLLISCLVTNLHKQR